MNFQDFQSQSNAVFRIAYYYNTTCYFCCISQFYTQLESFISAQFRFYASFYAKPSLFHLLFTSSMAIYFSLRWCKSGLECGPLHNPSQGPFSILVPGYASQWGIFCGDSLTSVALLMYSHWARHGGLLRLIPGTFVYVWRRCTATREAGIMRTSAFDWTHWTRLNLDSRFVDWWQSLLYVLLGLKSRSLVKVSPWLLCFFEAQ